jgi:hypothetical protein
MRGKKRGRSRTKWRKQQEEHKNKETNQEVENAEMLTQREEDDATMDCK